MGASDSPPGPIAESEGRGGPEAFVRNASSAVSSNLVNPLAAKISSGISGQPYADALAGINTSDASAAHDNPRSATAGSVAGTGLQIAAPLPFARTAPGAGFGARAAAGAKLGAVFGGARGAGDALTAGGGTSDAVAGGLTGALSGATIGGTLGAAVPALIRGAPERVRGRIVENISRGEAGGAAKGKLVGNMVAKGGEDGEKLIQVVEDAGLSRTMATKASAHPAEALKVVQRVLDKNETTTLGPVYAAIDKAGTGPDATTLGASLLDHADKMRAQGSPEIAASIDRYVKFLGEHYKPGEVLSGSMLRKLKGSIGSGAFQSLADENTPLGAQVKREIYGVYSRAVEDAAKATPGVDLAALKAGNEKASQLLGVQSVLSDRATKAAAGASTLANSIAAGGHKVALAGAVGHALVTGNTSELGSILALEGGHQIVKRIPQMIRHVDMAASGLEKAARANKLGAQVARAIAERAAGGAAANALADKLDGITNHGAATQALVEHVFGGAPASAPNDNQDEINKTADSIFGAD